MGFKCPECGKELSNKKGLAGHLYGVHGRRIGLKADLMMTQENAERALVLSEMHTKRLAHFMGQVEARIEKLENLLSECTQCEGHGLPPGYVFIAKKQPSYHVPPIKTQ